jgi:hypothetical protein
MEKKAELNWETGEIGAFNDTYLAKQENFSQRTLITPDSAIQSCERKYDSSKIQSILISRFISQDNHIQKSNKFEKFRKNNAKYRFLKLFQRSSTILKDTERDIYCCKNKYYFLKIKQRLKRFLKFVQLIKNSSFSVISLGNYFHQFD